jgi:hypothetical protein
LAVAGLLLVAALSVDLDRVPPPWWDEGWTLSVARNWVQLGHYGRLLVGEPVPRGLEFAFPVTGTIALSFKLFGVGIFQARFVAVLMTLAALVLLYVLTSRFYDRSIGLVAPTTLLLLGGRVEINPLIAGRQVMGETASLVCLLAGYACFLSVQKRVWLLMPTTICFWSLALLIKPQVRPFLVAALLVPLVFSLFRRHFASAQMFAAALFGSVMLYLTLYDLFDRIWPSSSVSGLTFMIALSWSKPIRLNVLVDTLQFGMPTLLGLSWALWRFLKSNQGFQSHNDMVRFSFFVLAGSWFSWYVALSIGWPRYMFPPAFLASMFFAAMLDEWTNHFNLTSTVERAGTLLTKLRCQRENVTALAATVLIAMSLGQTVTLLYGAYFVEADSSIKDTLRFLNTKTPPNALIETYESELFFLLRRPYHYPPDQVHVDLIRRNSSGQPVKIEYDPLAANPDYLVVGRQNRFWEFYDVHLRNGTFRLLESYGRYEIFERVR